MPRAGLIEAFDAAAARCASSAELAALLGEAGRELGFDHFALLHHASLAARTPRLIRLDTYPVSWAVTLAARGGTAADPVHLACGRTNLGFRWDQLGGLVPLTARHREILAASAGHGLGQGFTVPANIPGEPGGSCSFAVRAGRSLPVRHLMLAELLGAHAFGAARRLYGYPPPGPRARLSRREQDCLRLVAAGKTDWETARILGLGTETVRQYLKRARAAYQAVSRAQLVVHGLRDGWIGFDQAVPPVGPPPDLPLLPPSGGMG